MRNDIDDLMACGFENMSDIARVTGVTRSVVTRWKQNRYPISPLYQKRLIDEAKRRKLDVNRVAAAAGIALCPYCHRFHIVPPFQKG